MKKIHQFSGIYLSLFVTAHLINHLAALQSIDSHLAVMQLLRSIYKHPLIEAGLLLAVALQIITGLKMLLPYFQAAQKRKQPLSKNPWKRGQLYSGLYLAFFLLLHSSATLWGHYGMGVDTNFYFAAMVVQNFPHAFFFVPYYALGVISYFVHVACLWQLHKGQGRSSYPTWIILIIGVVVAVLIIGVLGQPMELPAVYQELING